MEKQLPLKGLAKFQERMPIYSDELSNYQRERIPNVSKSRVLKSAEKFSDSDYPRISATQYSTSDSSKSTMLRPPSKPAPTRSSSHHSALKQQSLITAAPLARASLHGGVLERRSEFSGQLVTERFTSTSSKKLASVLTGEIEKRAWRVSAKPDSTRTGLHGRILHGRPSKDGLSLVRRSSLSSKPKLKTKFMTSSLKKSNVSTTPVLTRPSLPKSSKFSTSDSSKRVVKRSSTASNKQTKVALKQRELEVSTKPVSTRSSLSRSSLQRRLSTGEFRKSSTKRTNSKALTNPKGGKASMKMKSSEYTSRTSALTRSSLHRGRKSSTSKSSTHKVRRASAASNKATNFLPKVTLQQKNSKLSTKPLLLTKTSLHKNALQDHPSSKISVHLIERTTSAASKKQKTKSTTRASIHKSIFQKKAFTSDVRKPLVKRKTSVAARKQASRVPSRPKSSLKKKVTNNSRKPAVSVQGKLNKSEAHRKASVNNFKRHTEKRAAPAKINSLSKVTSKRRSSNKQITRRTGHQASTAHANRASITTTTDSSMKLNWKTTSKSSGTVKKMAARVSKNPALARGSKHRNELKTRASASARSNQVGRKAGATLNQSKAKSVSNIKRASVTRHSQHKSTLQKKSKKIDVKKPAIKRKPKNPSYSKFKGQVSKTSTKKKALTQTTSATDRSKSALQRTVSTKLHLASTGQHSGVQTRAKRKQKDKPKVKKETRNVNLSRNCIKSLSKTASKIEYSGFSKTVAVRRTSQKSVSKKEKSNVGGKLRSHSKQSSISTRKSISKSGKSSYSKSNQSRNQLKSSTTKTTIQRTSAKNCSRRQKSSFSGRTVQRNHPKPSAVSNSRCKDVYKDEIDGLRKPTLKKAKSLSSKFEQYQSQQLKKFSALSRKSATETVIGKRIASKAPKLKTLARSQASKIEADSSTKAGSFSKECSSCFEQAKTLAEFMEMRVTRKAILLAAEILNFKNVHHQPECFVQDINLKLLKESEQNILKGVTPEDVEIAPDHVIHSVCYEPKQPHHPARTPVLMLHGMGGGMPAFYKNFEELCQHRRVYAIDHPGFALSSRNNFPTNLAECINKFIEVIDKWREKKRLSKFVLLGHSFGGYIAAAYAVTHPHRVRHLILADPWGILSRKEDKKLMRKLSFLEYVLVKGDINPFAVLRHFGPNSIVMHYLVPIFIPAGYKEKCSEYLLRMNSLPNPTGESAFLSTISDQYIWPKQGVKHSLIEKLRPDVPITFIYGEKSKYRNGGGEQVKEGRQRRYKGQCARVQVLQIPKVKHHIQVDDSRSFNEKVTAILSDIDNNKDLQYAANCVDNSRVEQSGKNYREGFQTRIISPQRADMKSSKIKDFQSGVIQSTCTSQETVQKSEQKPRIMHQVVKSTTVRDVADKNAIKESSSYDREYEDFQQTESVKVVSLARPHLRYVKEVSSENNFKDADSHQFNAETQSCSYIQEDDDCIVRESYQVFSRHEDSLARKRNIHDFTSTHQHCSIQSNETQIPAQSYSKSSSSPTSSGIPQFPWTVSQDYPEDYPEEDETQIPAAVTTRSHSKSSSSPTSSDIPQFPWTVSQDYPEEDETQIPAAVATQSYSKSSSSPTSSDIPQFPWTVSQDYPEEDDSTRRDQNCIIS